MAGRETRYDRHYSDVTAAYWIPDEIDSRFGYQYPIYRPAQVQTASQLEDHEVMTTCTKLGEDCPAIVGWALGPSFNCVKVSCKKALVHRPESDVVQLAPVELGDIRRHLKTRGADSEYQGVRVFDARCYEHMEEIGSTALALWCQNIEVQAASVESAHSV